MSAVSGGDVRMLAGRLIVLHENCEYTLVVVGVLNVTCGECSESLVITCAEEVACSLAVGNHCAESCIIVPNADGLCAVYGVGVCAILYDVEVGNDTPDFWPDLFSMEDIENE